MMGALTQWFRDNTSIDRRRPFSYHCSICDEVVTPDDVATHMQRERAKPTWPGYMSFTRVDHG